MKEPKIIQTLDLSQVKKQSIEFFWLNMVADGLGKPIQVPIMVARGSQDFPVVGITAAIHGNELNGISVIQRLFKEIDVTSLKGTIVGVPVLNVPSFIRRKRRFNDGTDLNHIMPGKTNGNVSEVYAFRIMDRIVKHFDYLIDLHTASAGRINSYYIRADMSKEVTAKLATLQSAQIIVNNPPSDGTLRGAADELDIPAITLEVGNPNTFQKGMIRSGLTGIYNILCYLKLTEGEIETPEVPTVLCKNSYWLYTDRGGLLTVYPQVAQMIKKDDLIAIVQNVFGEIIKKHYAPEDGVVIGKSVSPVNQTGGRILHLGIVKSPK
jgi:predicted deacylase